LISRQLMRSAKLGSSMLTDRYSAPSLAVFFQAAPISEVKSSVMWMTWKSGALALPPFLELGSKVILP
jgi:hypothetical protein